ncbi:immunoglobulin-binding protein 1-like [Tubulanus polymorphus]|uniref:immunoglobulin-binding protein 1-like n=1 Tax=Tubulanus polymorphus TaxID=672921 RepID=UPI003DA3E45A
MADSGGGDSQRGLRDIFEDLWTIYTKLDSSDVASSSQSIQGSVVEGVEKCTRAVKMVNEISLFSDNEEIDEISSNEIRYFLLPGLLAYFTNKTIADDRLEVVRKTRIYWMDFLRLCKSYGVVADSDVPAELNETDDEKMNKTKSNSTRNSNRLADARAASDRRQAKIERFKKQKQTQQRLAELYKQVQKGHVDEEVQRDYYLTLLNSWIDLASDELTSIDQEIPILEHMAKMKADGTDLKPKAASDKPKKPFRPFILTKTDVQKRVFGAGYPSLPTYSVEEFYEQQVQQGLMPGPEDVKAFAAQANGGNRSERAAVEKDEIEKEQKIEKDDLETLTKARQWDDWKDDHRRGWGNRKNMG